MTDAAERLERQMRFLVEVDKMKSIVRRNTLADGSRRENDAEHSWHFALMVAVLAEHASGSGIDLARTITMALVHDLVEIDAGDTFVYDEAARADQSEREAAAAVRIFGMLPEDQAARMRALWEEFEAGETPEARFARAIDRLNPLMLNHAAEGKSWREHGIKAEQVRKVNRPRLEAGSPEVWEFAKKMIDEAEAKGWLG